MPFFSRLDRAPEDVVSHLPTRIWSGTRWEKEGDWLKGLRKRAQRGQGEPQGTPDIGKTSEVDLESQALAHTPRLTVDGSPTVEDDQGSLKFVDEHDDEHDAELVPSHDRSPTLPDDEIPGKHQPWFNGQVECAICLSPFDPGDKVRILPCGHLFHIEEVDGWLVQRKKLCPICKADVTQPAGASSSPPPSQTLPETLTLPTLIPRGRQAASRMRHWLSHSLPSSVSFVTRAGNRTPLSTARQDTEASLPSAAPGPLPTDRTPLLGTPTSS